jgi:signal recognition particle subunit SRP54
MAELREIQKKVEPQNIFLVCDAMTGQDAVNSAKEFNDQLAVDGVILTKLDGDARGGAALSIRAVTGKPVKFVGMGEKLEKLEEFHPDRMASRILGMGDVVSLVEKAQATMDQEKAQTMAGKLLGGGDFTLQDFLEQMQSVKKMGKFKDILAMIPGLGSAMKGMDIDDKEIVRIEAMIQSMTKAERANPELINPSRRIRIGRGSGHTSAEVGSLLKQFRQTQKMFKGLGKMSGLKSLFGGGLAKAKKDMEEKMKSGELKPKKKRKPF